MSKRYTNYVYCVAILYIYITRNENIISYLLAGLVDDILPVYYVGRRKRICPLLYRLVFLRFCFLISIYEVHFDVSRVTKRVYIEFE